MVALFNGFRFVAKIDWLNNQASLCQTKSMFSLWLWQRHASSWKRRMLKQQQLKEVVYQYASKNTRRTDRVYVWGNSNTGALGVKSFLKPTKHKKLRGFQFIPYRLDYLEAHRLKPKAVSCGYGYTVYITQADHRHLLYGCGLNVDSQLGYQEHPPNSGIVRDYLIEPVLIDLPLSSPDTTKLVNVACGRAHTWILSDQEGIFSLGNNTFGQCGRSIVKDELYRASQIINRIEFDKKVKQVCCGRDHTLVLTEDGHVYGCGLNTEGQTGVECHGNIDKLTRIEGDIKGENIVSLSSRVDTVLAVSDEGQVFGWGSSEFGQLSSGASDNIQVTAPIHLPLKHVGKVTRVAASATMCALLNDEGDVYVWGFGVLGKGPRCDQIIKPERIPRPLFGCNELNPEQRVIDLFAGSEYFAALTESGELYMWGKNQGSCLGLGHVLDQYFPFKVEVPAVVRQVACGFDHTAVLCKSFA